MNASSSIQTYDAAYCDDQPLVVSDVKPLSRVSVRNYTSAPQILNYFLGVFTATGLIMSIFGPATEAHLAVGLTLAIVPPFMLFILNPKSRK